MMIDHSSILEMVLPGNVEADACDLRPYRRVGHLRRLHMFAMMAQAKPAWCDDIGRFRETLVAVENLAPSCRDGLLDDIDMAAWIHTLPLHPATPVDGPISTKDFQQIVVEHALLGTTPTERHEASPRILLGGGPSHVVKAINAAGMSLVNPGADDQAAERVVLHRQVDAALRSICCLWPAMALTVRRHIAAIAIHSKTSATSNWAFGGTVLFSREHIAREAIGATETFCESLAHETSHQMLFCVQEVERLIAPNVFDTFVSPWSGKRRPVAVSSHIPLTYLVVADYLVRLRDSNVAHLPAARDRLGKIVRGLDRFFLERPGQRYLTSLGHALHDQIEARFAACRDQLLY